jgi:hypothetical protein
MGFEVRAISVATAAKEFAARRNSLRREASECIGCDSSWPVTCKRVSIFCFENEKSVTRSTGFGLVLTHPRKRVLNSTKRDSS